MASVKIAKQARVEFKLFCKSLTNAQLFNMYEKESAAKYRVYATIVKEELVRRGVKLDSIL